MGDSIRIKAPIELFTYLETLQKKLRISAISEGDRIEIL